MKKIIMKLVMVTMVVASVMSLSACGKEDPEPTEPVETELHWWDDEYDLDTQETAAQDSEEDNKQDNEEEETPEMKFAESVMDRSKNENPPEFYYDDYELVDGFEIHCEAVSLTMKSHKGNGFIDGLRAPTSWMMNDYNGSGSTVSNDRESLALVQMDKFEKELTVQSGYNYINAANLGQVLSAGEMKEANDGIKYCVYEAEELQFFSDEYESSKWIVMIQTPEDKENIYVAMYEIEYPSKKEIEHIHEMMDSLTISLK